MDRVGATGYFTNCADGGVEEDGIAGVDAEVAEVGGEFFDGIHGDLRRGRLRRLWIGAHDENPEHEDEFAEGEGFDP